MVGVMKRVLGVVVAGMWAGCAARRGPAPDRGMAADARLLRAGIPTAAEEVLAVYAADIDPQLRGVALAVAVRAEPARGGGAWGTAGVWDPDPWVQARVVSALAQRVDETETVGLLSELAARTAVEPYTRCRAARFVPAPVPAAVVDATTVGWQNTPLWKAAPCALTASGWGDGAATERVAQAVAEGAVALDEPFLGDLAAASQHGLVDALKRGLVQADELLRPAYARALLFHGDSTGLETFRTGLQDDDPLVRMEAVLLLADAPVAADPLLGRVAQQVDSPEGLVAGVTVAARDGGGSIKPFEVALMSENRDVRTVCIERFGTWAASMAADGRSLPDRRVEKLLATAVVDPEVAVQRAAVEQIGRLGVGSLDPVVQALLADDDADPMVRIAAAEAAILLSGGRGSGSDAS